MKIKRTGVPAAMFRCRDAVFFATIADAISTVSAQCSALGAVQNRLEHTIANG